LCSQQLLKNHLVPVGTTEIDEVQRVDEGKHAKSRRQRTEGSALCPLGRLRDYRGLQLATDNVLRNDAHAAIDSSCVRTRGYATVPGWMSCSSS
jgi:hypothetical protein